MKYYRSERKIKCLNKKLGTDVHLFRIYVIHWKNVWGIKNHQALTYLSFSGFWRVRGFIIFYLYHILAWRKGAETWSFRSVPSQWFQKPAADWSHPAQSEPCPRNSTIFETSCDFSLIQVPAQIRWDQGNNLNNPLNVIMIPFANILKLQI